jgi:hypothetical protein
MNIHAINVGPAGGRRAQPWGLLRKVTSFPVFLGALLVFATLIVAMRFQVDSDTWWHLVVGQHILSVHSFPTAEIYSFTARGNEWVAHEWLGEVVLALALRAGGLRGLMGLLFGWASTSVLLTYYYAYLRSRNPKAAFVATMMVLPLLGVWFSLHPQLLGYIFLLITLICLERFGQGRSRALWFLPPVMLLWVNAHGTFLLGFLAIGIYWLSRLIDLRSENAVAQRRAAGERTQLLAVALASLLAGCVTPYGTRLLTNPAQMMLWQQAINTDLTSWQPLPLNIWHGKLFLIFVLLFMGAVVTLHPTIKAEEWALFLFAVVMTALHARVLPLFAIVFAPLLADLLKRWVPEYEPAGDQHVLNVLLMAAIALGGTKAFPSRQALETSVAGSFPTRAVEYLRQHPQPEPMFADLAYDDYLLYGWGPSHRVFIDGRLEVYAPAGVWLDYLHITHLDSETPWLLQKYRLQSCLIPSGAALATFLQASPEWKKVYGDKMSVLFVRSGDFAQSIK